MPCVRALAAVLLLATVAWGQIGTPPSCASAVVERERFRVLDGRVKFHLRFHTDAGAVDARVAVSVPRQAAADPACTTGEMIDFMIDELTKERQRFLGP